MENLQCAKESAEDNDSTCNECSGGGELLCCDGCIKAYHSACLPFASRPLPDSDGDWFCPECLQKKSFLLSPSANGSSSVSQLQTLPADASTEEVHRSMTEEESAIASTCKHSVVEKEPVEPVVEEDEERPRTPEAQSEEFMQSGEIETEVLQDNLHSTYNGINLSSTNKLPMGGRYARPRAAILPMKTDRMASSRSPSPAPAAIDDGRKRKKRTSEGSKNVNRINIGPGHQIPGMPVFFLNRDETDFAYSGGYENARLVYSPNLLDRVKQRRVAEGRADNVVKTDIEMALFIQKCAKNWKNQPGWQPFSPEFAYKMLHHAEYDPARALRMMNDPHFCFNTVCDPPNRKYENKWKPKDKRGQLATSPYPPPITLRGYLSRRQHVSGYLLR